MASRIRLPIILISSLLVVSCVGFALFHYRARQPPHSGTEAKSYKPLPAANLIDLAGKKLEDQELRRGKVILVFAAPECGPCRAEAQFLRTVVGKRSDVKFYGVVSFGGKKSTPAATEELYPFKVFYDEDSSLASILGVKKVPMKVYLEDGLMKKGWGGATNQEQEKKDFIDWLDSLS